MSLKGVIFDLDGVLVDTVPLHYSAWFRMFEEYDYQAATQFYIWAYAYLNGMGFDKGLARLGGDESSVYIFEKP